MRVLAVQRTGPLVRANVAAVATQAELTVEIPHLHHDAPLFKQDAALRLRLMQFSLYPHRNGNASAPSTNAPEQSTLVREKTRA